MSSEEDLGKKRPGESVDPPIKPRPRRFSRRRIGILGGSFNPAHEGHRAISLDALRRLDLDEIWWLVSPQNPLKSPKGMASLSERLASARALANHPRIRATSIEAALGTRYTADTLAALKRRFPGTRFIWLMGADNLAEIHRWDRWTRIFHTVPVAVFARPTYCFKSLAGKAAHRFGRFRLSAGKGRRIGTRRPPAWAFFWSRLNPLSATTIRSGRRRGGPHARTLERGGG